VAAGYSWLAVYDSTHHLADARRSHAAFTEALRKVKDFPDAHLGLGILYVAVEGVQLDPIGLGDATRVPNNMLGTRHLFAALDHGADRNRAARALREVAFREFDRQRVREIADRLAAATLNDTGKAIIAELYLGAFAADRALQVLGAGGSASTRRVRGIAMLFDRGTMENGAQQYFEALASADSALLNEFALDARWLADPDEARTWAGLDAAQLRARLRDFWLRRVVVSAVTPAQRLATHFARVQHAREEFNFYRQRTARFGAESTASMTTEPVVGVSRSISLGTHGRLYHVDDRAFVYVRYGEPDERIRTAGIDMWNESWVYRRLIDRPVSFDFILPVDKQLDARGWTLTYDVMSCGRSGNLPYYEEYVRDRQVVDPRYSAILQHCTLGRGKKIAQADVDAVALPFAKEREVFLTNAVVRDNAVPPTRKNVQLLTDVVQFRGNPADSDVTAVVAWPLNELTAGRDGLYRAKVSFFIADTLKNRTVSRDTVLVVRMPASGSATVRVHMTLPSPAADRALYRITLRDMNDTTITTVVGDTLDVRPSSRVLALSDIALAANVAGGSWQRSGRSLSLLPRGVAPSRFQAYYEIYNIAPQTAYTTRITFIPEGDALAKALQKLRGSREVSFGFNGENTGATDVVTELRAIGTELPAGVYTLRVAVIAAGQTATRERLVRIPENPR
jgi:hypothetical protein